MTNSSSNTIIGLAPYPVCLSNGIHITPGQIAQLPMTPDVLHLIDNGLLGLVAVPQPSDSDSLEIA